MRNVIFFDTENNHLDLLPITFTRPVCEIRVGIRTIAEKWHDIIYGHHSVLSVEYLREKYIPQELPEEENNLYIFGALLPDDVTVYMINGLIRKNLLVDPASGRLLAACCTASEFQRLDLDANYLEKEPEGFYVKLNQSDSLKFIEFPYHIFQYNGEEIRNDYYDIIIKGPIGQPLDDSNKVIGNPYLPDGNPAIFIEEGAVVEGAILNVKEGPIYIGHNAKVMEGSCIRGPFALCDGAKVNMGSKIYSDTTIGPMCKVGGELNNVVMLGHSNKAHDGYLGNAVIGEWCNIGAGTNASNLKNDYSKIRLWNYRRHTFMRTDLQFCGLIMGDHSKAGINCMFNTATVVGVGCNIHGSGFPRAFIPSFSEGSPTSGFTDVTLKKFIDIAERVMARRQIEVTDIDHRIFERVAKVASQFK